MQTNTNSKVIYIDIQAQRLYAYEEGVCQYNYLISSGKNGVGEQENSGCTPRGWHEIRDIIGLENEVNSVFVAREWTREIYHDQLAEDFPQRDWILTRILRLSGLEPGKNLGGSVDTYNRYIYIHGAPDKVKMGAPGSHGCIRMRNTDVIELANWVQIGVKVFIDADNQFQNFLHTNHLNTWSIES